MVKLRGLPLRIPAAMALNRLFHSESLQVHVHVCICIGGGGGGSGRGVMPPPIFSTVGSCLDLILWLTSSFTFMIF